MDNGLVTSNFHSSTVFSSSIHLKSASYFQKVTLKTCQSEFFLAITSWFFYTFIVGKHLFMSYAGTILTFHGFELFLSQLLHTESSEHCCIYTASVLWRDFCEIILQQWLSQNLCWKIFLLVYLALTLKTLMKLHWVLCNEQWMLTSPPEYSASVYLNALSVDNC